MSAASSACHPSKAGRERTVNGVAPLPMLQMFPRRKHNLVTSAATLNAVDVRHIPSTGAKPEIDFESEKGDPLVIGQRYHIACNGEIIGSRPCGDGEPKSGISNTFSSGCEMWAGRTDCSCRHGSKNSVAFHLTAPEESGTTCAGDALPDFLLSLGSTTFEPAKTLVREEEARFPFTKAVVPAPAKSGFPCADGAGTTRSESFPEAIRRTRSAPRLRGRTAGTARRQPLRSLTMTHGSCRSQRGHSDDETGNAWSFDENARLVDPIDGTPYAIAEEILAQQRGCLRPVADGDGDPEFSPLCAERGAQPNQDVDFDEHSLRSLRLSNADSTQKAAYLASNDGHPARVVGLQKPSFYFNSLAQFPGKDARKLLLYKTELCRSFEETGCCRYGPKCQFAHGREELRSVQRHPKHKSVMCKTFWEQGSCPYGQRCCFIHTLVPSERGSLFIKSRAIQSFTSNGFGSCERANRVAPEKFRGRTVSLYPVEDDAVNATINATFTCPNSANPVQEHAPLPGTGALFRRPMDRSSDISYFPEHFDKDPGSASYPNQGNSLPTVGIQQNQQAKQAATTTHFAQIGVKRLPIFRSLDL